MRHSSPASKPLELAKLSAKTTPALWREGVTDAKSREALGRSSGCRNSRPTMHNSHDSIRSLLWALAAALTLLLPDKASASDVTGYFVAKAQEFTQTSAAAPTLITGTPFGLASKVFLSASNAVSAATLQAPNNVFKSLTNEGLRFRFVETFASKSALDSTYASGTYTLAVGAVNDGAKSLPLTLPGDAYPTIPHVSNFAAAQAINASATFRLTWDAFVGGTVSDFIQVQIDGTNGQPVFITPDLLVAGSLNGTATFADIPANTLAMGQTYTARLLFWKITGFNTTSYPGVTGGTAYYNQTDFTVATVSVSPSITTQPVSQTVNVGQNVSFTVTATGTAPLSYQWRKDGTNLSGATSAAYSLTSVQTNQAGNYTVVVSNAAGSVTSAPPAVLTVNPVNSPPSITAQPQSQTVSVGASATFSVTATGTAPLSYQWQFNGANIGNATNNTYTIASAQTNNAGNYIVVISNLGGSVTSAPPAVLTVNRLSQTITFGALPAKQVGDASFALGATASSGLAVSYTSSNPGVATVSGSTITVVGAGTTTITADQAGDATYLPATSVSQTLTVNSATPVTALGTVVAWGDNSVGQTTVPAGLSNVVSVAAGDAFSVVLKSDGTVVAWGSFGLNYDITPMPAGLSNVVSVAAGGYHSVALKSDGTVVAWGVDSYGETDVPAGLSNVVSVAAGGSHSVALKSDGTVVAWGFYYNGETNVPVGLSNVVSVAAGDAFSAALKSDGTVVGWGYYAHGQTTYGITPMPAGLSSVVSVAVRGSHSVALKSDGTVVAWGDNYHGETNVPARLRNVVSVAVGGNFFVAVVGSALPVISNFPNGSSLNLKWFAALKGYRVQSTTSLLPPVTWGNESATFQTNYGQISTTLPMSGSRKFYRLIKP